MKADTTLDCYGLLCPMPIIQAAKMIKTMKTGDVLEVLSTDPGIREDMPAWCRTTGQEFLGGRKGFDLQARRPNQPT